MFSGPEVPHRPDIRWPVHPEVQEAERGADGAGEQLLARQVRAAVHQEEGDDAHRQEQRWSGLPWYFNV